LFSLFIQNFSLLVHPKYGQKRPETSPIPSSMHHHGQPSLGGPPSAMPAHLQQQMHQQQTQQKSQNSLQSSANNRSSEQSFAAALRSLAKQQGDIKDEEMIQQSENKNSSNSRQSEKEHEANRQASVSRAIQYDNRATDMRNLTSPQPPEKKV
jgi:molybdopterin-biosynthesis enzyme MoeA-like protein